MPTASVARLSRLTGQILVPLISLAEFLGASKFTTLPSSDRMAFQNSRSRHCVGDASVRPSQSRVMRLTVTVFTPSASTYMADTIGELSLGQTRNLTPPPVPPYQPVVAVASPFTPYVVLNS